MKTDFRPLVAGLSLVAAVSTGWADLVYWCGLDESATWLSNQAWSLTETPENAETDLVSFPSGGDAVFGVVDEAVKTVEVPSAVTVGKIDFRTHGHSISGTGPMTFSNGEIAVAEGTTNTLAVPLAGPVPYVKTGKGVLVLSGDNSNLKPASGTPITVREGLVKLTTKAPASVGCYTDGTLPVVVEKGGTFDLNGAFWDLGSYPLNVTIAGTGYDGMGALIDTGMIEQYNKYLAQVTLSDDALVQAKGQLYVSKVTSNGHDLTKIGGAQMCLSTFEGDGDIVVQQGDLTSFGTSSLGTGSGKVRLTGGRVAFWEGTHTYTKAVVVDHADGRFSISGNDAVVRKMVWKGPIEVPAGMKLTLTGSRGNHQWELQTDPTGTGTIQMATQTNWISSTQLTFPGTIRNDGILYVGTRGSTTGGTLGTAGWMYNQNRLVALGDDMVIGRNFKGDGTLYLIASNKVVIKDSVFTNRVSVSSGDLTFDSVKGKVVGSLCVGQANTAPYNDLLKVASVLTFKGDTDLEIECIQAGNGDLGPHGNAWPITGVVNQVSGCIRVTSGVNGDGNALHLGHWPMARTTYNMQGGSLTVKNYTYKLAVAVDGRGIFNVSGGDVYTPEFCLNGRDGNNGHGTLNVTGGTIHLGERGMTVGANCTTYEANLGGGQGGTIRAWDTNTLIAVEASLLGTDEASSVTLDTQDREFTIQRPLCGVGGFNKVGSGTLLLAAANTYAGVGRVKEGLARLVDGGSVTGTLAAVSSGVVDLNEQTVTAGIFAGTSVVSNGVIGAGAMLEGGFAGVGTNTVRGVTVAAGGVLGITVTADGDCGVVDFDSATAVALTDVKVTVNNPELLNPRTKYVFATCSAGLTASLDQRDLPKGWYVRKQGKTLLLDGNNGTAILLR